MYTTDIADVPEDIGYKLKSYDPLPGYRFCGTINPYTYTDYANVNCAEKGTHILLIYPNPYPPSCKKFSMNEVEIHGNGN